jgi:hypothetical protein
VHIDAEQQQGDGRQDLQQRHGGKDLLRLAEYRLVEVDLLVGGLPAPRRAWRHTCLRWRWGAGQFQLIP